MDIARCSFAAADADQGLERRTGRSVPPLVPEIPAAATTNRDEAKGGLNPRLFGALAMLPGKKVSGLAAHAPKISFSEPATLSQFSFFRGNRNSWPSEFTNIGSRNCFGALSPDSF